MKNKGILVIVILLVAAVLIYNAAYSVDETEQVIVTQFGRIIGEPKKDPGLKFKIPFIQQANYFAKNLLDWDGDPGQIPTLDKTFIWVDTFARWKITDPVKFFQTVNNRFNAIGKLNDIIDPAVRNFITSNQLIEAVRKSDRDTGSELRSAERTSSKDILYDYHRPRKNHPGHIEAGPAQTGPLWHRTGGCQNKTDQLRRTGQKIGIRPDDCRTQANRRKIPLRG